MGENCEGGTGDVPGGDHYETFQKLTAMLLLTYALRNADCHAKNIALLYTSRDDASLAPAYEFFTTSVYAGYQHNPPGIGLMGKKTGSPARPSPGSSPPTSASRRRSRG